MHIVRTLAELEALYGEPVPSSLTKEIDHLTPLHQEYVSASPFVLIATSGAGGLDCSPRGDPAGFVRVPDERTLLLPDRRGNNRLDTLRNLVTDPRIGLLFLVPGIGVTLRVNGTAVPARFSPRPAMSSRSTTSCRPPSSWSASNRCTRNARKRSSAHASGMSPPFATLPTCPPSARSTS